MWEYKNLEPSATERVTAKRCREIIGRLNGQPQPPAETTEEEFHQKDFKNADIAKIPIDPRRFNQTSCSPRGTTGKVKAFPEWSLAQMIDVACELGYLKIDVKKFSHALRGRQWDAGTSSSSPTKPTAASTDTQGHQARPSLDASDLSRTCRGGKSMRLDFLGLPSDERRLYIEQAATRRNVSPVILEKDF